MCVFFFKSPDCKRPYCKRKENLELCWLKYNPPIQDVWFLMPSEDFGAPAAARQDLVSWGSVVLCTIVFFNFGHWKASWRLAYQKYDICHLSMKSNFLPPAKFFLVRRHEKLEPAPQSWVSRRQFCIHQSAIFTSGN